MALPPPAGTTSTPQGCRPLGRWCPNGLALLLLASPLGLGCSAAARLGGVPSAAPPLPAGFQVVFNHRVGPRYRSPVTGQWRSGDDLEAFLLDNVRQARRSILVAVQELSLPRLAEALVEQKRRGLRVQVVLENNYSSPWSEQHPADLEPHQRQRQAQLRALGWGDAVALLRDGGVPMLDDTADGSAGSGLMHHKFMVIDGQVVVTGSANFTASGIHGDAGAPQSRGNVNHLLRIASPELASLFTAEFRRLWGDGPGGAADSRFGIAKDSGGLQTVQVGGTGVSVLFAPHRRSDPRHGLQLLETLLLDTRQRADLALFVFSDQRLAAALGQLQARGVAIRVLADPGFATRSFSEVLDLLGVALPDHRCGIEANNAPLKQPLEGVGTPRLAAGDKMHHKVAVLDQRTVITGSFNWSPSAAHQNDETLLVIHSPLLARHFTDEVDRLWKGAELGITARLQRKRERQRLRCGSGLQRPPTPAHLRSDPTSHGADGLTIGRQG
ncbi:phosphatidylserine/phosphatidylglycerophosphate/cardiolipin synthase family protein [Cyanobium sp. NIES-981]|uniref:phospholipase D-like domain-containing protein n=1 Tax=Cyanobium sp. NIES-981 TaxID=1851505 RepID=UPI0007DCBCE5|nr:phosphatidylserine/phosphatidylglycerophosphate/cardiolipin synthase family protein [Cyanobium sp. NIES-981]SBO44743.1 Phospholipase D domain protein (modular protein) [Cyanobium sp. NIES-981]